MHLTTLLGTVPLCRRRQAHKPFWTCDLPRGHDDDCASIALRRFVPAA